MSKIKVKASYTIGNSAKQEAVVQVDNTTKGEVDQAIAKQLGIDVRHIDNTRIQVIK